MALTSGAALVAGLVAMGGLFGGTPGDGKLKQEERSLAEFSGVQLSGDLQAELRVGDDQQLVVITDSNLLPLVRTEVRGGVLHVETAAEVSPTQGIRVIVTSPRVAAITAREKARVVAEVAKTASFRLRSTDSARVAVKGLDTESLTVDLSGATQATLAGQAKRAKIDLTGDVSLTSDHLEIEDLSMDASSDLGRLLGLSIGFDASSSGGASLKLNGHAVVDVDDSEAPVESGNQD